MRLLATALFLIPFAATAQQTSAPGKGTVTGHVLAGDTERPARLATVVLYGIPEQVTAAPKPNPDASQSEQMATAMKALSGLDKVNLLQVQTNLDGSFTATDVLPGDYYVFATAAGYVSPLNTVTAIVNSGADVKKQLPGVPTLRVSADRQSSVDLTMQRGGAISGTLSWDDGSPISGAVFTVTPVKGDNKPPTQFAMLAMAGVMSTLTTITNDIGQFRVTGLTPGDYILKAQLAMSRQSGLGQSMNLAKMMQTAPLVVFSPSGFHAADSKPITVHAGEELRDQNVTLNLSNVHSVSGRVESIGDHHGINQATIKLTDVTDKEFFRQTGTDAAGNFTVTFLPPGTYEMKVFDAEDTVPDDSKKKKTGLLNFGTDKTVRSYLDGKQSVIITDADVTGQIINLSVDKNPKKDDGDDDMQKAIGNILGGSDAPK